MSFAKSDRLLSALRSRVEGDLRLEAPDTRHPGKPVENAFAESLNGRLRVECLNINWFMSIKYAR